MAHQAVKPYSFILYFLSIIAFFFLGLVYAGITDAGKGQMMAAAAIVFSYGVIGALLGFVFSLFIAFKASPNVIKKLNIVLLLIIAIFLSYFTISSQNRNKEEPAMGTYLENQPQPIVLAASFAPQASTSVVKIENSSNPNSQLGLGMFAPNITDNKSLYFYNKVASGKSLYELMPTDSVSFKQLENGGFDIATAPPWLVPDHLKLDYNMLFFKVVSISQEFIEVVVNTTNNQTAFVDRHAGKLQYWPEFMLGINSVEFVDRDVQKIYVKPLDHAGVVTQTYAFMQPLRIKHNWMQVELLNDNVKSLGKGWIKWRDNNKLLIKYSLLS